MRHSRWISVVYALLPLNRWKDVLLRGHLEKCPECAARIASREEVRRILVQAGDLGDLGGLWPAVRRKILGAAFDKFAPQRPAAFPVWRWGAAAAGFLGAAFLIFALVRSFQTPPAYGGDALEFRSPEFQVHYVNIDNEPARTVVFKPVDSHLVIVWAERNQ